MSYLSSPTVCEVCTDKQKYRCSFRSATSQQTNLHKRLGERGSFRSDCHTGRSGHIQTSCSFPVISDDPRRQRRARERRVKTCPEIRQQPWNNTADERMLELVRQRIRSTHPFHNRRSVKKQGALIWLENAHIWIEEDDFEDIPYLNFVHKMKTEDLEQLHKTQFKNTLNYLECPRYLSHNQSHAKAKAVLEQLAEQARQQARLRYQRYKETLDKKNADRYAAKITASNTSDLTASSQNTRTTTHYDQKELLCECVSAVSPVKPNTTSYAESWCPEDELVTEHGLIHQRSVNTDKPTPDPQQGLTVSMEKNLSTPNLPSPLELMNSGVAAEASVKSESTEELMSERKILPSVFPNFYIPKSRKFERHRKKKGLTIDEAFIEVLSRRTTAARSARTRSSAESITATSSVTAVAVKIPSTERANSSDVEETAPTEEEISVENENGAAKTEETLTSENDIPTEVLNSSAPEVVRSAALEVKGSEADDQTVPEESSQIRVMMNPSVSIESAIATRRVTFDKSVNEINRDLGQQHNENIQSGSHCTEDSELPVNAGTMMDTGGLAPDINNDSQTVGARTGVRRMPPAKTPYELNRSPAASANHEDQDNSASRSSVGRERLPVLRPVGDAQIVNLSKSYSSSPTTKKKSTDNSNRKLGILTAAVSTASNNTYMNGGKKPWILEDESDGEDFRSLTNATSRTGTEMSFDIHRRSTTPELTPEPEIISILKPLRYGSPEEPESGESTNSTIKPDSKPVSTKRFGKKNVDNKFREELERQRLAEERKKKAMKMRLARMTVKKNFHGTSDDSIDGFSGISLAWLEKYCIYTTGAKDAYKNVFKALLGSEMDNVEENPDKLTRGETLMALKNVNRNLRNVEADYIISVCHLMGYDARLGCDLSHFSLMAALSHKITSLEDYLRSTINKADMINVDMKAFMCRRLWEATYDPDTGRMSRERLLIELKAGGISPQHEELVKHTLLSYRTSLDFLDFLTYIPLFLMIHMSVIQNPLDDSRVK